MKPFELVHNKKCKYCVETANIVYYYYCSNKKVSTIQNSTLSLEPCLEKDFEECKFNDGEEI